MAVQAISFQSYFRYAGLAVTQFADGHFEMTQEMVTELRQLNYIDQWKISRENRWCHILLDDLSFFAFSEIGGKPSFGYYPCPLDIDSLGSYLKERGIDPTKRNRMTHSEEYDMAVQTAALREFITPIRYDIDSAAYKKCIHPAAHLHIGWDNQVRIATRRILTPLAFILFIIRQTYPANWEQLLAHGGNLKLEKKIRWDLQEVEAKNWLGEDDIQSYLY